MRGGAGGTRVRRVASVRDYGYSCATRDLVQPETHRSRMTCVTIPNIVIPPVEIAKLSDTVQAWLEKLSAEQFFLFVRPLQSHKGLKPLLVATSALSRSRRWYRTSAW